jgi:aldose 1-epimerase
MYELHKSAFGPYTRYQLHHPATGNGFSVAPERGANVLDIHFGGRSILDGHQSPEELQAAKWGKSAVLFPFPNRLDRGQYQWQGSTYQFPINNAATENAIHGFVRDESFEVAYVFLAKDHASILCRFDYDGSRPYYPFLFQLELEFLIHDDGHFSMEAAVRNEHDTAIPVGLGWHPYFRLTAGADAHHMQLPVAERVVINERMIPTGERSRYAEFQRCKGLGGTQLDTCFHYPAGKGSYRLALEAEGQRLEIKTNARQFPFFQVFTPPHRESIALEPMSCNVDAFNNGQGLVALEPGREWKGKMEIAVASR